MEKAVQDSSECGIAYELVRAWHRTSLDPTSKAVTHDKFISGAPLLNELGHLCKVVAVVGIPHDYELAVRSCDAGTESVTVSLDGDVHYARAVPLRDFDGAVRGPVV